MSKRYDNLAKLVDANKTYSIEEAVKLAKQTATVKFDASLEVHVRLNIDPKQTDQKVRAQATLPHGTGKTLKLAAFVTPAKERVARDAGADIVGGEELVKQIKESEKTDFDVAVAEPALMKNLAQVAKILGQRGLMPNPKAGTVGEDVAKLIKELKGGGIEIKADDQGNVHQVLGKLSFDESKLVENFRAFREALFRGKPGSVKKEFISSITINATMGPGIKVQKS